MPVRSKAQQAYLAIHHPEILRRWAREYGGIPKDLPEHVERHAARQKALRRRHRRRHAKR